MPLSLLEREVAEVRWRTEGRGGRAGGERWPVMADSGIRRRVEGSTWLDEGCAEWVSRFGRARAQERRVDRLARSAAS